MRVRALVTALLIGAAVVPRPGRAQNTSGITDSVFTNPGARSIGLGGAFAAIADDATAAFANPAGLVQILRPEISVELRGTAARDDTGAPYELANGISGLGFFSFVSPYRSWAFALYSHQLASLDFSFSGPIPVTREFSVRSYAGAAALEIDESLSLGAGVSYFRGERSSGSITAEISDADWGFNAGVLWNPSPPWKFAGFYRQGPAFETDEGLGAALPRIARSRSSIDGARGSRLCFPNEYGLGVAFRPSGGLTFGFEWDRASSGIDPLVFGHTVTEGGSEFHFGAEYAVLRWRPVVAFRTGYWLAPGRRRETVIGSEIVSAVDTETSKHFALGFGLAFKRFQVDAGVDISQRAVVGSASFVYSF